MGLARGGYVTTVKFDDGTVVEIGTSDFYITSDTEDGQHNTAMLNSERYDLLTRLLGAEEAAEEG